MAQKYKITFSGIILFGYDETQTKIEVQNLLKLNSAQMEQFFSGKMIVIKKNLPLDEAQKIVSALESKGLLVELEEEMESVVVEKKVEFSLARDTSSPPPPLPKPAESSTQHNSFSEHTSKPVSSYYASPNSPLTSKRDVDWGEQQEDAPDFFKLSFEGRYGRLNYLNMSWAMYSVILLMMVAGGFLLTIFGLSGIYLIAIFIGLFFAFFTFRATILRLHDLNKSGWLSLILLAGIIPLFGAFVEFVFALYLIFARGTDGHNDYGAQPKRGSIVGLIFLCLSPIFIGILVGFSAPAYQDYIKRTYVAEGIALALGPKMAVTEYYGAKKSWPSSNAQAGLPEGDRIKGTAIESMTVAYDGKIMIQFNQLLDRAMLILEPSVSGGQVDWNCYGGTILPKHRPKICRR